MVLAYNGTEYFGSQIQKETNRTILGKLDVALQNIGIDSKIVASGRTDKGVHATGQVCHIDLPNFWSNTERLKEVLNQKLPKSILIKKITKVTDTFHARYSAKKRSYRYILKESLSNPFENDFITFLPKIEFETLEKNIKLFEGEHDFAYFMKQGSDIQSSVRTIYKTYAYKHNGYIVLYFQANGFLRSQIRLMVGALLQLNTKQIEEKLSLTTNHKSRPAPPNGLYLSRISYETSLPETSTQQHQ